MSVFFERVTPATKLPSTRSPVSFPCPSAPLKWLVLQMLALEALEVLALAFRQKSFNPFMLVQGNLAYKKRPPLGT